jgi:ABC-type transport system involved in multi-copper enzyme maturation permease subunit
MWPVIHRELREQARLRSNVGLRLWGASLALAILYWQLQTADGAPAQNGTHIFGVLNVFLVAGLWLIGPVLSADCLSQEKRAGTFNLLFLTPLKPLDIVLGKAFVHGWRAVTFLAAAFPVLVIPLLLGGIGWRDLVRMCLTQSTVLALALTAGLLASALSKGWMQARVLAVLISVGSGFSFLAIYVTAQLLRIYLTVPAAALRGQSFFENWYAMWSRWMDRLSLVNNGYPTLWLEGAGGNTNDPKLAIMAGAVLVSLLLVIVMVMTAARHVRQVWRSPPLPPGVEAAVKTLTRDRFAVTWQKRWKDWVLDSNPVGWLETARWEQRLIWAPWLLIWLALIPFINSSLAYNVREGMDLWALSPMIVLIVILTSVASFRRERSEGGFELLLATTLPVCQLVRGRFAVLIGQVVPIFLVWVFSVVKEPLTSDVQNQQLLGIALVVVLVADVASLGLFLAVTRIPYLAGVSFVTAFSGLGVFCFVSPGLWLIRRQGENPSDPFRQISLTHLEVLTFAFVVLGLVACRAFLGLAETALTRRWFLARPNRRSDPTSRGSR